MSFFRFILRQICDKDFVLLQIVLQKTEIGSYNIVVFLTICISYANNCFTL